MDSDGEMFVDSDSENESSELEDEALSMVPDISAERERVEDEFPYKILTTEQIVQHMVDCIRDVNMVVEIPPTITRILLTYFKWDNEKLYERYYDGDPDSLFAEARVVNPLRSASTEPAKKLHTLEECEICFQELPDVMMTGLACGHRFCSECWKSYLTTKIMDQGNCQTIPCAAHGCDILVDDQTVMNLITDPKIKLKYQHLITNSFVECNRLLQWCPQPECNNAVKVHYVEPRPVTCACGFVFCFVCIESWHDPVKCHLLKKWQKKCSDDSETLNWIGTNTKDCPRCKFAIEKNGGCNHMTCKNQNCNFHFCWVCLRSWNSHDYNCNRYDDAARAEQADSRAALERYLFYCNHYMNHMQSLKFENKLYASIEEKMKEMQQHKMSWIEVQYLKKAVDVLCQCRQTLMYTYVFAYYLRKNNQVVIFEDNQSDLENATEQLSEYLERDMAKEDLMAIKQKVQDKYKYCESRRKVLRAHVHEGYEKEWWDYTE